MNSIVCWLNAPTGRCEAAPVINDRRILTVADNLDDESLTQRGLRPAGAVATAHSRWKRWRRWSICPTWCCSI
jgi:hypothetical protein